MNDTEPNTEPTILEHHNENQVDLWFSDNELMKRAEVTFTWPCGETFTFALGKLIAFNEGAQKAGVAAGQRAWLNMESLGHDYWMLAVDPSDDYLYVQEGGNTIAQFHWGDLHAALLAGADRLAKTKLGEGAEA